MVYSYCVLFDSKVWRFLKLLTEKLFGETAYYDFTHSSRSTKSPKIYQLGEAKNLRSTLSQGLEFSKAGWNSTPEGQLLKLLDLPKNLEPRFSSNRAISFFFSLSLSFSLVLFFFLLNQDGSTRWLSENFRSTGGTEELKIIRGVSFEIHWRRRWQRGSRKTERERERDAFSQLT